MPVLVQEEVKLDQVCLSQHICCATFQIRLPVITHHSAPTDHDTHLDVLSLLILSLRVYNWLL